MFDLVFFTKSALTDGAGWKSSSGVILGVRDERDDMVDTTFFFLCLGHGRDLFFLLPIFHISGRIMHRRHRMGKILLVGWCNVTAICWEILFLVHAIYSR